MSEEINYIPEPPETFEQVPAKKKNATIWIIVGIVAVLLLCCCLVAVLGLVGVFSFETFDQMLYQIIPNLYLV